MGPPVTPLNLWETPVFSWAYDGKEPPLGTVPLSWRRPEAYIRSALRRVTCQSSLKPAEAATRYAPGRRVVRVRLEMVGREALKDEGQLRARRVKSIEIHRAALARTGEVRFVGT
jgi:hypothetical protein